MVGRPRMFDEQQAVQAAMVLFWAQGYEGTSMADLTAAMGLNGSSLYRTFGNKQALFRRVVRAYLAGPAGCLWSALEESTARRVAYAVVHGTVDLVTGPGSPRGDLVVQAALAASPDSEEVRADLVALQVRYEQALAARLTRAPAAELPADAAPQELAGQLCATRAGIAVRSTMGASGAELHRTADLALDAWPNPVRG